MITEIFGENCKRARVFDLLLSHPHSEYTKTDIAEYAEISRTTLDTFIDELVEKGILKTTNKIGNSQLYQINMDSTITQALNSFQNQLADIEIEKQLKIYEETNNVSLPVKKPFEEMAKNSIISVSTSGKLTVKSSYTSNKQLTNPFKAIMTIPASLDIISGITHNNVVKTFKHSSINKEIVES